MCHAIQFMPILAIYLNYYPFVISERFEVVYLAVSTRPILPFVELEEKWQGLHIFAPTQGTYLYCYDRKQKRVYVILCPALWAQ